MKAAVLFKQYVWLVDTIRRERRISLADLCNRWSRTELSEGAALSRTTFNRHRAAVEENKLLIWKGKMVWEMAMLSPFYFKILATGCSLHFWCIFLDIKKSHKHIIHKLVRLWGRKERDSNPRTLAGQRFSRPPHSTALPSFQLMDR